MELETLRTGLGWVTLINVGLLLLWFGVFCRAHEWLFGIHTRWFRLAPQRFDELHYCAMAVHKLLIWVFLLGPYIALWIVA